MKGPCCTSHLSPVCTQTHTHTSVHMHRLNPSTPPSPPTHTPHLPPHSTTTAASGLSEVSVISCSARLNYDVNKSPLDPPSTPTSPWVRASALARTLVSPSLYGLLVLTWGDQPKYPDFPPPKKRHISVLILLFVKTTRITQNLCSHFQFVTKVHNAVTNALDTLSIQIVTVRCPNV